LVKNIGISTVITTDIVRDGILSGPNKQETKEMIDKTGLNIIASGGITDIEDLRQMKEINASGAIVGKALYTGAIQLSDALRLS
ncbi:MAG: 1-(5-phosphoribosyl)-5-((5-phosphoribosylamino)methylideneamino)imidazole-4-carboxamide isomerase, partial [Clostridiales bacterium]|nr:1-(5-phosphoribosyl)-5-((5-phosphoribosylamino)methylideneamino)imidazole-4-carboxamide isomerase [Clostridiales bacterium]